MNEEQIPDDKINSVSLTTTLVDFKENWGIISKVATEKNNEI